MAEKLTFESGLAKLEEIVTQLETGAVSLEDSFKAYQTGVKLYKKLEAILNEGDARIIELTGDGDNVLEGDADNENV